jgi:hypothetical protein
VPTCATQEAHPRGDRVAIRHEPNLAFLCDNRAEIHFFFLALRGADPDVCDVRGTLNNVLTLTTTTMNAVSGMGWPCYHLLPSG